MGKLTVGPPPPLLILHLTLQTSALFAFMPPGGVVDEVEGSLILLRTFVFPPGLTLTMLDFNTPVLSAISPS